MKRPALIWLAIVVPLWLVFAAGVYWEPIIRDGWGFLFWHRKYDLTWPAIENFTLNSYVGNNPRIGLVYTLVMYKSDTWHLIATPLVELALPYLLATLALGRWASLRRTDDALVFATVTAMVLVTAPSIGPLLFYRPFTGNYTVGLLLNLVWLVPYRFNAEGRRIRWWWTPVILVLGVAAGMSNEHTGPAFLAVALFGLVVAWRRGERILPWAWAGVVGMTYGIVQLLSAPGQQLRYGGIAAKQSLLEGIVDRGVLGAGKQVFALPLFLLPLAVWIVPAVIARRRGVRSEQTCAQAIAGRVALATAGLIALTLIASPRWADRLYFAPICLVCAAAAGWVCSFAPARERRITAAISALVLASVSVILLVCQHRLHAEFVERFATLEHATPGSTVRLAPYSQERSRFVLGDDFVVPRLRAYVARTYELEAIELDQRAPTTPPPDEP